MMENTGYLLMNISKKMRYELNQALKTVDLTAPQWAVLQQLERQDCSVSANELTKRLEMDKPTLSAIIKRLEQKQLLYKEKNPADQRISYLHLTKAGRELMKKGQQISDTVLHSFLIKLSADEQTQLNHFLKKIDTED